MTAAGRVSPNSSTSLTAMMLETISVEAEAATTSGYQRGSALAVPLAMLRLDRDGDPPAHLERPLHTAPARFQRRHQVIQDLVGHVFVGHAFIPVGPQVELEGLRLEDPGTRDVLHGDGGEIRLAGGGAHTGELVTLQPNHILAIRMVIGKGLQLLAGPGRLSQQRQTLQIRCLGQFSIPYDRSPRPAP